MSDNVWTLQASASPFQHDRVLRQEGEEDSAMSQKADAIVVLVTDDDGDSCSAAVASRGAAIGAFAAEAVRLHAEALPEPAPTHPHQLPELDEVALGGFLLFGAARSSR